MRKLHIGGKVWLYKIGGKRSSFSHPQNVIVRSPDNKRFNVSVSNICGITDSMIEHDYGKGSFHLRPSQIKVYIENNFIAKKERNGK